MRCVRCWSSSERAVIGSTNLGVAVIAQRRLFVTCASVAVIAGVAFACMRAWLCDDAFISFRYADNLVAGDGLVFNAGERVEGA